MLRILFLSIFILAGCESKLEMTSRSGSSEAHKASVDAPDGDPSPIETPAQPEIVKAPEVHDVIVFGRQQNSLIGSDDVVRVTWAAIAGAEKIIVEITAKDQESVICKVELDGSAVSSELDDCDLSDGHYEVHVKAIAQGKVRSEKKVPLEKNVFDLGFDSLTLHAGESVVIEPVNGFEAYEYVSDGVGVFSSGTSEYMIPVESTKGSENLIVTDGIGQTQNVMIHRRAFEELARANTASPNNIGFTPQAIVEHGGDIYMLANATMWNGYNNMHEKPFPMRKQGKLNLHKSTDGGTSWDFVSTFEYSQGYENYASELKSYGGSLYASSKYVGSGAFRGYAIHKSDDNGVTWEKVISLDFPLADGGATFEFIFTPDGHLLLGGKVSHDSKHTVKTIRCELPSKNCTEISSDGEYGWTGYFTNFQVTNDNSIYYSSTTSQNMTDSYVTKIWKSTDDGLTFTEFEDLTSIINQWLAISVSPNGQHILLGGVSGASQNLITESLDGGSTWNLETPCVGWNVVSVLVKDNNDRLISCLDPLAFNKWALYRKLSGGSWTQQHIGGQSGAAIIHPVASGDIFFVENSNLSKTTDFATNVSNIGMPATQAIVKSDFLASSAVSGDGGSIFIAGSDWNTDYEGVVKRASGDFSSWVNVHSNTNAENKFLAIGKSPTTGTIVVAGQASNKSEIDLERRDFSNGSWSRRLAYTHGSFILLTPSEVRATDAGVFYMTSKMWDTGLSSMVSTIKKSTDDGLNWTDVVVGFQEEVNENTELYSTIEKGGAVWSSGHSVTALRTSPSWYVVKDPGGSPASLDSAFFTDIPGTSGSRANKLIETQDGSVFAAGTYIKDGVTRWVVRKTSDETNWSTSDDFVLPSGQSCDPISAIEFEGRLYVAGSCVNSEGRHVPLIRMLKNDRWFTVNEDINNGVQAVTSLFTCKTNQLCALVTNLSGDGSWEGVVRILSE